MRAGRKCTVNLNSGTYATPTWSEATRVSGVKIGQSRGTTEKMFRGAKNKKTITGFKSHNVSFQYLKKDIALTDDVFDMLQASFDDETVLDVALLDKTAASGAEGLRGPFVVSKFDRSEDDEDAVVYDVELVEIEAEQSGALWEVDAYTVT